MEAERSRSRDSYNNRRPSSPSAPIQSSTELYVTFLPSNIQEDNVRQIFQECGTITRVYVKKKEDGFTFAFVTYETPQMAKQAVEQLNGAKVGDKIIRVAFSSKPKRNGDNTNSYHGNSSRPFKGDMDSSSDGSMRSESRGSMDRNRDSRGRGRGRGRDNDRPQRGRGRGGGFHRGEQSDVRRKFGNNDRNESHRPYHNDRDFGQRKFRDDRNGRDNKYQRNGEKKSGAFSKYQESGHRGFEQNNHKRQQQNGKPSSKTPEVEFDDY